MIQTLLSCTITILKVLLLQYSTGDICYSDFISHTDIKVKFLSEHLNDIADVEERKVAEDILKALNQIVA